MGILPAEKRALKFAKSLISQVPLCPIVLKFERLVHYGTFKVAELLKSPSRQIQYDERPSNFQSLNRYNSAADCLMSLKFGTEFNLVTADTLQVFKVKGSRLNAVFCLDIPWGELSLQCV